MARNEEELAANRFMLAVTIGLILGVAIVGTGFAFRPDGSGVWYGFGVVMAALVAGTLATIVLGFRNDG